MSRDPERNLTAGLVAVAITLFGGALILATLGLVLFGIATSIEGLAGLVRWAVSLAAHAHEARSLAVGFVR